MREAERLLLKAGDESAVSIRAIASAVGVTPPSIYLHFRDKTELIFAVCGEHFRKLDDLSEAAVAGVSDPAERVALRGRAYITFGLENPEHYRIMFMARPDACAPRMSGDELAQSAAFGHLLADVQAGLEGGQLVGDDAFTVACGLWAVVHGITSLLISKPEFPWPPLDDLMAAAMGTHRPPKAQRRPKRR